jgi:hypothetical protein
MDRLNGMSNILIFLADTWSLINTHSADCTLIFRMTDTERIVELKEDDNSPNSTSEPDSCKDAKPPKAMQPDTDQSESADIHGLEVFRRIHYIRTFITIRVELNPSVDTEHNILKEQPAWSPASELTDDSDSDTEVAGGTFPGQQPTMTQQQQQQLRPPQQPPFGQPPPDNVMYGSLVRFPLPFLKL